MGTLIERKDSSNVLASFIRSSKGNESHLNSPQLLRRSCTGPRPTRQRDRPTPRASRCPCLKREQEIIAPCFRSNVSPENGKCERIGLVSNEIFDRFFAAVGSSLLHLIRMWKKRERAVTHLCSFKLHEILNLWGGGIGSPR